MFIGMIGVTYTSGLSSVWFLIGWILGDFIASLLTVKKIQQASKQTSIHSYGGLLAHWHSTNYKKMRVLVGLLTVFFLTIYAAAQLKAGSKATSSLLGWSPQVGVLISASIVMIYSVAGGLRASIWTDVAQSIVMVVGMILLMLAGIHFYGGVNETVSRLSEVSPVYLNWMPDRSHFYIVLFIFGWLVAGFTVIGQPHIVIRFMSLNHESNINRMRLFYYGWYTLFFTATIIVGLLSRIVIPEVEGFDAELALPNMAIALLPHIIVGLILAALFAATMSTADSQILACSASITRDIFQNSPHTLGITKLTTFIVLVTAVAIALSNNETVFSLVLDAWGMLASAFVPLVVLYSLGKKVSERVGICMIAIGPLVFALWNQLNLGDIIYSVVPGVFSGIAVYLIARSLSSFSKPQEK